MQTKSGSIDKANIVTFKRDGAQPWKLKFQSRPDAELALYDWWHEDMAVGKLLIKYDKQVIK